MTNTSTSMKKSIPANSYSVLRVVENGIAMEEQIDALMLVPMDSDFIGKMMLTSMVTNDASEHVPVMTPNSISMKNGMAARPSSVLRVVD